MAGDVPYSSVVGVPLRVSYAFNLFQPFCISYSTQVKATDRDLGVNAQLSYRLSPQTEHADVFSIDADTGQIYIRSALDYERNARYHLTVMACDGVARNQLEDASTNVTTANTVNLFHTIDQEFYQFAMPEVLTMMATNQDDQHGEIYATMLYELNCTFGASFSRLHCCDRHGMGPNVQYALSTRTRLNYRVESRRLDGVY